MSRIYGRIIGWGAYVPENVITNHDLETTVDTSHEWIVRRSGIEERRIATDGETTATMSARAGRRALRRASVAPTELDLIIVATTSPDYYCPPVSSQVQHELGAINVPAFVLQTGCTSFVYALATAYQLMAGGAYQRILVVGAETISRFVNWQDRSTCVLFGDGAAAVVIQAISSPCGLRSLILGSDGSGAQHIVIPAGGVAEPITPSALANGRQSVHMNGRPVFKFATRILRQVSRQLLEQAGMMPNDIDWIIPHQANLRIVRAAARDLALPLDRFYLNLHKYGNTCAASIALALAEGLDGGQIKPADKLLLVSFGAGLT